MIFAVGKVRLCTCVKQLFTQNGRNLNDHFLSVRDCVYKYVTCVVRNRFAFQAAMHANIYSYKRQKLYENAPSYRKPHTQMHDRLTHNLFEFHF